MDPLQFYGVTVASRLLLGTAQYPSPAILADAITRSEADILTVSLRRESTGGSGGRDFWKLISAMGKKILPNTAGCHSAKEAITTAEMARDVFGLVEAARELCAQGFQVFPYTTDDLIVAEKLLSVGCEVLMPWGAPIGSGKGLNNRFALKAMRAHFPNVPLVVDAGLGVPSHAADAMELGYDAVLLNTAVAKAGDPVAMAEGFALAVKAGRLAYRAGAMEARDMAVPSTPVFGQPFV
ncbi:MAG: thiazole synthase [Alphaproteobacteria bacterium]|nr:thiazole synthase [Alphaproteobacteria bacterium]